MIAFIGLLALLSAAKETGEAVEVVPDRQPRIIRKLSLVQNEMIDVVELLAAWILANQ